MLEQALSRDMVLTQVARLLQKARMSDEVRKVFDDAGLPATKVLAALQSATNVQGDGVSPSDQKAYIPRQEEISLLQALIEQAGAEDKLRTVPTPGAAAHRVVVGPVQDPGLPLAQQRLESTSRSQTEGLGDFDMTDALWAKTALELITSLHARMAFQLPTSPPKPFELADNARLILVSDWGTGGPAADRVKAAMQTEMQNCGDRECHVIHLGDVYYAGTSWEAQHRFLDHWPVDDTFADRSNIHSWCLNGNHDMYAAGAGLLGTILPDDRFSEQRTLDGQCTTLFHLKGSHWQIFGLDSAWRWRLLNADGAHGELGDGQVSWLEHEVVDRDANILLSHHQPFSRQHPAPARLDREHVLLDETSTLREGTGVRAWFWGHEHRCITYPAPAHVGGLGYGACIGHGAVPTPPVTTPIAVPPEWEYAETTPDSDGDFWRTCGFAVVDLDGGGEASVRYVSEAGVTVNGPDKF